MYSNTKSFDIVCAVSSFYIVGEIKHDLVPAWIQPHRHRGNVRFDACCDLIIGSTEPAYSVLVIQNLHFKRKISCQVLNEQDDKR